MDGRNKKFILELQKKSSVRRSSGLYTVDGPKMAGVVTQEVISYCQAQKALGLPVSGPADSRLETLRIIED